MKKIKDYEQIEVIYGENENAKLEFIRFMIDYFFDKHLAEVRKNEESSRDNN